MESERVPACAEITPLIKKARRMTGAMLEERKKRIHKKPGGKSKNHTRCNTEKRPRRGETNGNEF